ncbi:MAG: response regulator [Candidatus Omnitrophica bacterium]|nr:response regulator [Candidatus Omnitrophota bacterium]
MEKKFNILLVDDEMDFIEPIAFWLEAKGYSVQTALNGKDALKLVGEKVPDIVLLDINMPIMNGIDTLKNIRENNQTLPVIMITAELEQLPVLQELGISGFFPKEGTLAQLEQLLEPIIRIHAKMKASE